MVNPCDSCVPSILDLSCKQRESFLHNNLHYDLFTTILLTIRPKLIVDESRSRSLRHLRKNFQATTLIFPVRSPHKRDN